MRKIEKVKVSQADLDKMKQIIMETVRNYNPETGETFGHIYTDDCKNGYIVQENNIVLHREDGSLKCWYAK